MVKKEKWARDSNQYIKRRASPQSGLSALEPPVVLSTAEQDVDAKWQLTHF
jgi:hypothetical protein